MLYIVTCLFNIYAEYIMWNAGLNESQAGVQIAGRNINNLRYADDTILKAESKEGEKKLAWNSKFKKLRSWHLDPSLHGK